MFPPFLLLGLHIRMIGDESRPWHQTVVVHVSVIDVPFPRGLQGQVE
jgi:hypothetical protein